MKSITQDFTYKLSTGIVRIPANFLLQIFYARILGPINYGNFDYILNLGTRILNLFDTGTSKAFFTKLSSKNDSSIFSFYFFLVSVFIFCLNILIIILFYIFPTFFPSTVLSEIILIINLAACIFTLNATYSSLDAIKRTVYIEKFKVFIILITVVFFSLSFLLLNNISTSTFVSIHLSVNFFAITFLFLKQGYLIRLIKNFSKSFNKSNYNHILLFVKPLFFYSLVTTIVPLFERWLLKIFGGSIELGYFSISFKLAALILIFTSAFIPLFTRELSILSTKNDNDGVRNIYLNTVKRLLVITLITSVLISNFSTHIISIIGGGKYYEASSVLAIMCYYPVFQTLGQINGSFFYSTKNVKIYSKIGIYTSPISLIILWLLVAPNNMYGFDLGALGFAIQMVIFCIITVLIQQFFVCRLIKTNFFRILIFQLILLTILISLNLLIRELLPSEKIGTFIYDLLSSLSLIIIVSIILYKNSNFFLNISNIKNFLNQ